MFNEKLLFYLTECLRIKDKKRVNEFALRIEKGGGWKSVKSVPKFNRKISESETKSMLLTSAGFTIRA
jgi:hypothetical protein